jgi:branched-chain amino acid transport system permease protein
MQIGAVNAGDLGFQKSFEILIMVVLGGLGSISGTLLAAVILTILPEALRSLGPYLPTRMGDIDRYRMIIYALVLIVMMIVRPKGLLGVGEVWDFLLKRRRRSA